jgi:glycosyltransferase involved in cell wall biosynthesis
MNILFFLNIMREGAGMINREMSFAQELHKLDYKVSILSYFKPTSKIAKGIKVHNVYPTAYRNVLYTHFLSRPYAWLKIFLILLMTRPKVVMVDLPGEAQWAYRFRKLFNFKVIFTYHGVANSSFYKGRDAEALTNLRTFGHDMLKKADKILVVSDFLLEEVNAINLSATTIYNGFDEQSFNEFGSTQRNQKKLIFIGRFTEYKGAFNIVHAFAKAHKSTPEATLEMYGFFESELYVNKIKKFIARNNLQNAIALMGPLPKKYAAQKMKECGVFINGSVDETFCMPLLEAQACGTPCIAFDAGGIPEVIANGKTGLLAEANNINDMADKISLLLNNKTLYNSYRRNTHRHTQQFSYKKLVKALDTQIQETSNILGVAS